MYYFWTQTKHFERNKRVEKPDRITLFIKFSIYNIAFNRHQIHNQKETTKIGLKFTLFAIALIQFRV